MSEFHDDGHDCCFICHASTDEKLGVPQRICECAWLVAHPQCLARWQLTRAGKPEERTCRFCQSRLSDWRTAHSGKPTSDPIMSVVYNGTVHQLHVSNGRAGRAQFERDIRRIFNLGPDDELALSFGCRVPGISVDRGGKGDGSEDDEQELTLEGWDSFDAAVFCASLSAGSRKLRENAKRLASETPDKTRAPPKRKTLETPGRVFRRLFGGRPDCDVRGDRQAEEGLQQQQE